MAEINKTKLKLNKTKTTFKLVNLLFGKLGAKIMVNMYLYYSLLFIILVVKEKGAGDLINLLAPSFTCKGRGDLTIERGIYGH